VTVTRQVTDRSPEGAVPPHVEAAARRAEHPAVPLRAGHARLAGSIPSLIVTGGTETTRDITAALYVRSLAATGALSHRKTGRVRWTREENLPGRGSDSLDELAACPLLILTEVGAVVREDSPGQAGLHAEVGCAPFAVANVLRARGERLPTVVTTLLPAGNPPLAEDDLDRAYSNYALGKALDERGRWGWAVPSPVTGFDPDAGLVPGGTATLRGHLGEASWWRLYLTAFATAIDAGELRQQSGA
jgi:hypothetical protein